MWLTLDFTALLMVTNCSTTVTIGNQDAFIISSLIAQTFGRNNI